jgi:hypothetical protein
VDGDQLIRLTGTAKHILSALGEKASKRKPPAPTLQDHIARRAADRAEAAAEFALADFPNEFIRVDDLKCLIVDEIHMPTA